MTIESVLAPGARVIVRDEEWLVRSSVPVGTGGYAVRAVGMSELVRNQERSFLTALDDIQEMRPEDTELVADPSPQYRRSRLYLESLLRRTGAHGRQGLPWPSSRPELRPIPACASRTGRWLLCA